MKIATVVLVIVSLYLVNDQMLTAQELQDKKASSGKELDANQKALGLLQKLAPKLEDQNEQEFEDLLKRLKKFTESKPLKRKAAPIPADVANSKSTQLANGSLAGKSRTDFPERKAASPKNLRSEKRDAKANGNSKNSVNVNNVGEKHSVMRAAYDQPAAGSKLEPTVGPIKSPVDADAEALESLQRAEWFNGKIRELKESLAQFESAWNEYQRLNQK